MVVDPRPLPTFRNLKPWPLGWFNVPNFLRRLTPSLLTFESPQQTMQKSSIFAKKHPSASGIMLKPHFLPVKPALNPPYLPGEAPINCPPPRSRQARHRLGGLGSPGRGPAGAGDMGVP